CVVPPLDEAVTLTVYVPAGVPGIVWCPPSPPPQLVIAPIRGTSRNRPNAASTLPVRFRVPMPATTRPIPPNGSQMPNNPGPAPLVREAVVEPCTEPSAGFAPGVTLAGLNVHVYLDGSPLQLTVIPYTTPFRFLY